MRPILLHRPGRQRHLRTLSELRSWEALERRDCRSVHDLIVLGEEPLSLGAILAQDLTIVPVPARVGSAAGDPEGKVVADETATRDGADDHRADEESCADPRGLR